MFITLTTYCPFCGATNYVLVREEDYIAWQNGELAQIAFPYLSTDEREMLISGICPACWDEMFGSDEEPDPDDHPIQQGMLGVVDDYALEFMEHMED